LPRGDRISIGIETLDDVVFASDGAAVDILQTKHHTTAQTDLTDASPNLWKTLKIWIEIQSHSLTPQDIQFFLITTAKCNDRSAAAYLRPDSRSNTKAQERLIETATNSTNEANRQSYEAFNSLSSDSRSRLVKSISVLEGAPSIEQIDDQLQQSVFFAVQREFLKPYLERLEGWWYRRVLHHLRDNEAKPILGEEVEAEASRIREQFKVDNLPIDDDIMHETVDASGYLNRTFVDQLRLIGINHNRIVFAIRNYYRAFVHRSRWVREDLLFVGELERYESRLIEEWEIVFQQMCDNLGEDSAEEHMTIAAQNLYNWVETGTHSVIRSAVTEPAIARGTYQMLADDLKVGWHVQFRERLQSLLTRTSET